jgi:hypothetical protein
MSIAEEPAESSSDELTQIGYDEKTTLLSGKPLVEAMLEIKERGASHQNMADEIDEMAKGDKPRFGGFPCPSQSMVQKICSDVNKLQQAGVASRLAKFEFTISSWVSHRVRSLSPGSDRGADSGSCSDGASGHDSSSFSSSDEHDLEEEEAPEGAEALDSRKRKVLSPEEWFDSIYPSMIMDKAMQQSLITPIFWAPNEEYMNWYEKQYASDSEDETDEVEYRGWHYVLAAMLLELKKKRCIRRWRAACQRHAKLVSVRTTLAKCAGKNKD